MIRGLALAAAIVVAALVWPGQGLLPASPSQGQEDGPFLRRHPVVVLADRLVCSLLGEERAEAGIVGEDGSHTVAVNGVVYWNFGDTVLSNGGMIPNSLAWSTDDNAADCIALATSQSGEWVEPMLRNDPDVELSVWPLGMEATAPDRVQFFYASIARDDELPWRVIGVGLGSFDTETMTVQRDLGGALPWTEGVPLPSRTFSDDRFVYVFLGQPRDDWSTDTFLARVPKDSMESLASYQYWQPSRPGERGHWVGALWNEQTRSWSQWLTKIDPLWNQPGLHNGVEVAYNEFLGRWLAVYTSALMSSVNVRAADRLTGPWDGPETVLVNCPTFHPPPREGFLCYTGVQHEFYTRDGGRTIYVSYSNGDTYQVYLHEIRLAAPVTQWSDERGRAIYLAGDAEAPDGFHPDGLVFYASDIAAPGFTPIHRWLNTESGEVYYGASPPNTGEAYRDLGVDFYAPADAASAEATNALHAPVYRWTLGDLQRFSPLNLAPAGYARHEVAFYAACPDADGDGLTDCLESFVGTDLLAADSDGDGLSDGLERTMPGCDPLAYTDDADGVSLIEEISAGTNPCMWDSGALAGQQPSTDSDTST